MCILAPHTYTQALQRHSKNSGSLCSLKEVVQGQSQTVPDMQLHQSLSQDSLAITHLLMGFRQNQSTTQILPEAAHPKGDLRKHQTLLGQFSLLGQPPHRNLYIMTGVNLHSQPEGQPQPWMTQQQSKLN